MMRKNCLSGISLLLAAFVPSAAAQGIQFVTRWAVKSPAPGVYLLPTAIPANAANNPAPPPAPVLPAPAPPRYFVPTERSDDDVARRTLEFQRKRAEAGASYAQFDLGVRYLKGDGVEKNMTTARGWLERAAGNGHTQARKRLQELEESK
jgi:TPR repeat protein